MASFEEHCRECKEKLGEEFPHVHRRLDEFFVKMGYSVKHRDRRHHADGVVEVRKQWGERAAQAAILHIKTDFYGYMPECEEDVVRWRLGVVHSPGEVVQNGIVLLKKHGQDS